MSASLLRTGVRAVAQRIVSAGTRRSPSAVTVPLRCLTARAALAAGAPTGKIHPTEDVTLPQIQVR